MRLQRNTITVFEHQTLVVDKSGRLTPRQLEALQRFHGKKGVPYYSLCHNGVKFCEYVGVLRIGNTTLEILPKTDRSDDAANWRSMLINILKSSGAFKVHAPTNADLKLKSNSILDLYIQHFIIATEKLYHQGLIKKYRREEGNCTTLKGSLQFSRHIIENLIRKDRFFTRHNIYDWQHTLNKILYKTIQTIAQINTNISLEGRIDKLKLIFPPMPEIEISEALFDTMRFTRKTEMYKDAISVARLLLLSYHPDLSRGKDHVVAILFDMNLLWQQFVLMSLRKYKSQEIFVSSQIVKRFWKPENGRSSIMRPDIVIKNNEKNLLVLDTKWKNIGNKNPSAVDLRQMFAYSKLHQNARVALVYPGNEDSCTKGEFYDHQTENEARIESWVMNFQVEKNIIQWQQKIAKTVFGILQITAQS